MRKRSLLNGLLILLPLLAVILTALPNSFRMRFFAGGEDYFIEYVSGFDPILMGYGNFGPMAAGVLSIVLTLRGILHFCQSGRKPYRGVVGMALAAFAFSLVSIFLTDTTIYNWLISAALLALAVISWKCKDKETK